MYRYDYSKLKGRIREICGTNSAFAKKLGCSLNTLSAKLNNKSEFTQSDIMKSTDILNIGINEIPDYYFCSEVKKQNMQLLQGQKSLHEIMDKEFANLV